MEVKSLSPTPSGVKFWAKLVKMCLGGEGGERRGREEGEGGNIARVVGRWRVEPKANRKFVIRSRVLCNNYFKGFFHSVPNYFEWHIQQQMAQSKVCNSRMTNHIHHVPLSVKWFHFTMLSIVTFWLFQCCWPLTGHGVSLLCRKISSTLKWPDHFLTTYSIWTKCMGKAP